MRDEKFGASSTVVFILHPSALVLFLLSVSSPPEASGDFKTAAAVPTRNHWLFVLGTPANCGGRGIPGWTGKSV
jgi:hypothetical protein